MALDVETKSLSFNLVYEPWIPVVRTDGAAETLSLQRLFLEAPKIREIAGDCPQQSIVIIRLALAVLYRAYETAYDAASFSTDDMDDMWLETWHDGVFDEEVIDGYLDEFSAGFDLFGDHPFMQVPGLAYQQAKGSSKKQKEFDSVSELVADVPKPEKFLFSTRARQSSNRDRPILDSLGFAEAARWLLFAMAYDTAGIKTPVAGNSHVKNGKAYPPKGLCGTGLLGGMEGVYLEGENLFQTLMLNWVLHDDRADNKAFFGNSSDLPAWELSLNGDPAVMTGDMVERAIDGPVSLFTWQSRRIRLVADDDGCSVKGVIRCYGDVTSLERTRRVETMCPWRENATLQKKLGSAEIPWTPIRPAPSKALWRGLSSLLSVDSESGDFRPGVVRWADEMTRKLGGDVPSIAIHAQGMSYGTQSSVFADGMDDYINISTLLLRNDAPAIGKSVEVVANTDKAVFALKKLAENLERVAGDKRSGADQAVWIEDRAYTELDQLFRDRLANFREDVDSDEYCIEWSNEVHCILLDLGDDLLNRTGASQFAAHGDFSAADAFAWFKKALNDNLGVLPRAASGKEQR